LPNTPQPLPRLVLLKKKNQTFGIEIGTEDDKFGNNSHRLISIASSGPAAKTDAKSTETKVYLSDRMNL